MKHRRNPERGQTTTEFAMMGGLILVGLLMLSGAYGDVRGVLRSTVECVVSDVCRQGGTPMRIPPPPPLFPARGGGSAGDGRPVTSLFPIGDSPVVSVTPNVCGAAFTDIEACGYDAWDERFCDAGALAPHSEDLEDVFVDPGGYAWDVIGPQASDPTKNAFARLQNCKALRKRSDCLCGECDQCDGLVVPTSDKVQCVYNDTDSLVADVAESAAMIRDISRMVDGGAPIIDENDAIRQMKNQITAALATGNPSQRIELIGFSQGSIILSSALWQLNYEARSQGTTIDWGRLNVVVFGAAEHRFPPGLNTIDSYINVGDTDSDDALPLLSDPIGLGGFANSTFTDAGKIADPLLYTFRRDCKTLGCHQAEVYVGEYANRQWRTVDPLNPDAKRQLKTAEPQITIMVNGVNTQQEDWNRACQEMASQRYPRLST